MSIQSRVTTFFDRVRHAPSDVYSGFRQEFNNRRLWASTKTGFGAIYTSVSCYMMKIVKDSGMISNPELHQNMPGYLVLTGSTLMLSTSIGAAESFRRTGRRTRITEDQISFTNDTFR